VPTLLHIHAGVVMNEHPLTEGSLRLGRGADNDVRLDDSTVSTHHAVITVKPSPYMEGLLDVFVDDLGSTNGTTVNGTSVRHQRLRHDDVIRAGDHEFRLVEDGDQPYDSTRIYLPETED
jgi:pSer/pThr/pTyr-binding forkhead associated (FHA) protein